MLGTSLVDFDRLERDGDDLHDAFASGWPFRHVVIDHFADPAGLAELVEEIPDPHDAGINKSRDYFFARNKFEKSGFAAFGPRCRAAYEELCSDRFRDALRHITGEDVFVDPTFHGGGMHQSGPESFLDLHVDFNLHPLHDTWFRNLNVLLYLNQGWEPSWGGSLQLRHKATGEERLIEPIFNRCLIMETRDFTQHGFRVTAFPPGVYRRSIATYAYAEVEGLSYRSSTWYPEGGGIVKRAVGRAWPTLVKAKNRVLGFGTSKNY
ncbi:MAG: 2OG-Fe(II) oxygenase [Acidimicrobiales bacterium]